MRQRAGLAPALVVVAAGISAALHVGKLPPAVGALRQAIGLSLVEAGFLLSLVQLAGLVAAIAVGAWVDHLGARRAMLLGLSILAAASIGGGFAHHAGVLLALRAVEGFGFLVVVLPAPGLVRQLVPPERREEVLGLWGAYMPVGAALGLLAGPFWIEAWGWPSWWRAVGVVSAAMAVALAFAVPAGPRPAGAASAWSARLAPTLSRPGPWIAALTFAAYSSQWLAVIGFLPTMYEQAGVPVATRGVLTSLAAAANIVGTVASGRLLQRGVAKPVLLAAGFIAMALAAAVAFARVDGATAPLAVRYAAVIAFSAIGGLIPTALCSLALQVAPQEHSVSTTIGLMQQGSALGQFAGPPVVAWLAGRAGGWQWTWAATGVASLAGLWLASRIARLLRAT